MFDSLLDKLTHFFTRKRLAVVAFWLVLTALLGVQIPALRANFTPSDLFARFADQQTVAAEFRQTFGNTDNIVLVLVRADNVLAEAPLQYLHDLSLHFREADYIERVESVTVSIIPHNAEDAPQTDNPLLALINEARASFSIDPIISGPIVEPGQSETLREALLDSPLMLNRLISDEFDVAAIALVLAPDLIRNHQFAWVVGEVQAHLLAAAPPAGVELHIGGLPYVRTEVVAKMKADQSLMLPAAVVVILLILLLSFRWLPAVAFPLLAVIISAVTLVGGMALLGEPFNIINNIVPLLILIIGISNSIHVIQRYIEELRAAPSALGGRAVLESEKFAANQRSIRAMTVACFLTTFTTAVGFASLLVSRTDILRNFGITAAVGIMLSYVVTLSFLPAGLALVKAPPRLSLGADKSSALVEAFMTRLTSAIMRRPWPVLAGTAVVAVACLWLSTGVVVNSAVLDQLDEDDEIYQTTRLIEERLGGVRPLEVSMRSPREGRFNEPDVLNAIDELQRWALQQEGVLAVNSYPRFLHEAWYRYESDVTRREAPFESAEVVGGLGLLLESGPRSPIRPYVTPDRRRTRVNIQVADVGAQQTLIIIDGIERKLEELFDGLDEVSFALTGDAYSGSLGLDLVIRDFQTSILTAVIIIFGFMTLLFRSLKLGLISIPPNVIPLVGAMAYMAVNEINLNAATVIIFSVSIGLAVDGSIHVLARFREEIQAGRTRDEALLRSARGTGKAIIFTGFSLMLGFGVMLFSSFPPVRRFGELISVTVFCCLVATLVVLPALLKVCWPAEGKRDTTT